MLPVNSILKLPPELYVEIFNTACRSQWDIFHDTDTDIGPKQDLAIPFRLCGVCRHWREIIMSSPVLWSDITIGLFSSTLDHIITVFEMYLGRSGECLLTIKLSVEDEDDEWCQSVPNRLIQLLASSAFRWRAINMTVPDSWLYALFKLEPVFHNLKTVRMLLVDDAGFAHPQKITFDLFKNTAPVLENLYMYRYYPRMVEAPWKQLTRLSIESVDIKECFQVLEKTTKLTCFKVYNIWSRVEGIGIHPRNGLSDERPISLPFLRTLILTSCDWPDIMQLISSLDLPSLKNLELSNPCVLEGSRCGFMDLPPVLAKANAAITRFVLWEPRYNSNSDVREFLWNMPLLQSIHIDMPQARYSPQKYLVLNFLRPFIPDSQAGRAYPLPNLEEFSFSGWIASKDEGDICRLLVDALTARRTSSSSSQGQLIPSPYTPVQWIFRIFGRLIGVVVVFCWCGHQIGRAFRGLEGL